MCPSSSELCKPKKVLERSSKGSFVLAVQLLLMCSVKAFTSTSNTAPGPVLVHKKC